MRSITPAETNALTEIILRDVVFPNVQRADLELILVALSSRMRIADGAELAVIDKMRRAINRTLEAKAGKDFEGGSDE